MPRPWSCLLSELLHYGCASDSKHDHGQGIHNAKGIEHHSHYGLKVAWRIFQSFDAPIETVGQPDASEVRYSHLEAISLIVLVGDYEPIIWCRRLRLLFPEALCGLHFRRLMVEHRAVKNVSDEDLSGYQHGPEHGSQRDSPARKMLMFAFQQIPSAYSCDHE